MFSGEVDNSHSTPFRFSPNLPGVRFKHRSFDDPEPGDHYTSLTDFCKVRSKKGKCLQHARPCNGAEGAMEKPICLDPVFRFHVGKFHESWRHQKALLQVSLNSIGSAGYQRNHRHRCEYHR